MLKSECLRRTERARSYLSACALTSTSRVCHAQHFGHLTSQASIHMWHHEDAGVGFNVLRNAVSSAVVASPLELNGPQSLAMRSKSMPTHYIALPGHYNDPYIIERTRHVVGTLSPEDEYWAQVCIAHNPQCALVTLLRLRRPAMPCTNPTWLVQSHCADVQT